MEAYSRPAGDEAESALVPSPLSSERDASTQQFEPESVDVTEIRPAVNGITGREFNVSAELEDQQTQVGSGAVGEGDGRAGPSWEPEDSDRLARRVHGDNFETSGVEGAGLKHGETGEMDVDDHAGSPVPTTLFSREGETINDLKEFSADTDMDSPLENNDEAHGRNHVLAQAQSNTEGAATGIQDQAAPPQGHTYMHRPLNVDDQDQSWNPVPAESNPERGVRHQVAQGETLPQEVCDQCSINNPAPALYQPQGRQIRIVRPVILLPQTLRQRVHPPPIGNRQEATLRTRRPDEESMPRYGPIRPQLGPIPSSRPVNGSAGAGGYLQRRVMPYFRPTPVELSRRQDKHPARPASTDPAPAHASRTRPALGRLLPEMQASGQQSPAPGQLRQATFNTENWCCPGQGSQGERQQPHGLRTMQNPIATRDCSERVGQRWNSTVLLFTPRPAPLGYTHRMGLRHHQPRSRYEVNQQTWYNWHCSCHAEHASAGGQGSGHAQRQAPHSQPDFPAGGQGFGHARRQTPDSQDNFPAGGQESGHAGGGQGSEHALLKTPHSQPHLAAGGQGSGHAQLQTPDSQPHFAGDGEGSGNAQLQTLYSQPHLAAVGGREAVHQGHQPHPQLEQPKPELAPKPAPQPHTTPPILQKASQNAAAYQAHQQPKATNSSSEMYGEQLQRQCSALSELAREWEELEVLLSGFKSPKIEDISWPPSSASSKSPSSLP